MYDDMAGQLEKIIKAYIEKRIKEEMEKFSKKLDDALSEWTSNKYGQYGMAHKMESLEETIDHLQWRIEQIEKGTK